MEQSPKFWCHECKAEIRPKEDFSCPNCSSGFIEPLETEDGADLNNFVVGEQPPQPTPQPTPPQQNQFPPPPAFPPFLQNLFQGFGIPPQAFQPGQAPQPGATPGQPGVSRAQVIFSTGDGVQRVAAFPLDPTVDFQTLINQAFAQFGLPVPVGVNPFQAGADFHVEGGGSFQDILNQLFMQHNPQGPPPTSKEVVENLRKIAITKEHVDKKSDCTVCVGYFEEGEEGVVQLPCEHIFHEACITPWLNMSNSCPVCRFELPTDDKEYEENKKNKNNNNMRSSQGGSGGA